MFETGTILTVAMASVGTLVKMITSPNTAASWARSSIIAFAITLHILWGIGLLISPSPQNITAIAALVKLGMASPAGIGVLYLTVALSALLGMTLCLRVGLFFLLPQALMLCLSASGALKAMWCGCFADGVVRDSSFLVADQAPAVITAIMYCGTLVKRWIDGKKVDPTPKPVV